MNILFICRFNRFRSKIAEAFFNRLSKQHKSKSAGIIAGGSISKEIIDSAKDFGIKIKSKPIGLTIEILKWHDLGIIVADDVPRGILRDNKKYGKQVRIWKIHDPDESKKEELKKTILQIEAKVKSLVKELG